MSKEFYSRELSACEAIIMKAIWDNGEDMPLQKLLDTLRDKYHKDYPRTTAATFLPRLHTTAYVTTNRVGRTSFSHPEVSLHDYRMKMIRETSDFWFDGDDDALAASLAESKTEQ